MRQAEAAPRIADQGVDPDTFADGEIASRHVCRRQPLPVPA